MKFNFECTPEEMREFLGLPDVKPMQAALLAKIERQALEAVNAASPDALFRTWLPAAGQMGEQFQSLLAAFTSNMMKPRKKD
jgi:hypothetical protein